MALDEIEKVLTPPEVARLLRVDPHTVIAWIRGGELRAVNVARRESRRPRFRVFAKDLEEFARKREYVAEVQRRRQGGKANEHVIEFS